MDLHTPNLESATLDWQGQGESSLFFLPGNMETADTQLTAEGRWLFRCRVADHVGAGMEVLFWFLHWICVLCCWPVPLLHTI